MHAIAQVEIDCTRSASRGEAPFQRRHPTVIHQMRVLHSKDAKRYRDDMGSPYGKMNRITELLLIEGKVQVHLNR